MLEWTLQAEGILKNVWSKVYGWYSKESGWETPWENTGVEGSKLKGHELDYTCKF